MMGVVWLPVTPREICCVVYEGAAAFCELSVTVSEPEVGEDAVGA